MKHLIVAGILLCVLGVPLCAAQTGLEAWHAAGQTWMVWIDDRGLASAETYDVYRSTEPIDDLSSATLIGRVLPNDWRAVRLDLFQDGSTWRVPDGEGGARQLGGIEVLFVYTPHEAREEYFAVVKHGETEVGPANTVGPVAQTLDPVTCHEQLSGTTDAGYEYTVWAQWVDGSDDHTAGRPGYPVMGNAGAHGVGHVFTVYEPLGGRPPGELPAVLQFHGGKGNFTGWEPGPGVGPENVDNEVDGGFVVAMDDGLQVVKETIFGLRARSENTRWFGWWEGYDRFSPPEQDPPDDALVVDYTQRRVRFTLEWLLDHYPIDPNRVGLMGHSMGGLATSFLTRHYPELFSAGTAFEPPYYKGGNPFNRYMQGSVEQNLVTTLPGDVRLYDFYKPATLLPGTGSLPFVRIIWGKNDESLSWDNQDGINNVPRAMNELNTIRRGHHIDWDQRSHRKADWEGRFVGSPRHSASEIARHRADRSFPAISDDDHDPAPGRQPDPGDGPPTDGDPWGTWGGYVDWNPDSIEDTPDAWATTLYLVGSSDFPADIAPRESATATVTPRRLRAFAPVPGESLYYTSRDAEDDSLRQHGPIEADSSGVASVEGLAIPRDPERVRLRLTPAIDDDRDARDAQVDCDDASPETWSPPGEAKGLTIGADTKSLSWDSPPDPGCEPASLRYDLIRADAPDGFTDALCLVADEGPDRSAEDEEAPAPGAAFHYLVRALNPCPDGAGSLGTSSSGAEREGRLCESDTADEAESAAQS